MSKFVTRHRGTDANLLEYASKNRNDGFFNDITIIAGNESISANRLVLSYHSKHFEGMFKTSILKNEKNIEIRAVDGKSMKALINFIYNGSIIIDDETVKKLLSGAVYLELDEVKEFCFEFLQSNIRADNALDIFRAAATHKKDELKGKLQEYISVNLDEISKTVEFKTIVKDDLISLFFNLNRFQTKEKSIYQAVFTWIRYDEEARKTACYEIFKMINLQELPKEFLEKTVLEEDLVTRTLGCQQPVFETFQYVSNAEKSEPNELHMVCLGGTYERKKVAIVDSFSQNTQLNYADFEVGKDRHCSVKLYDHVYTIGGRGNYLETTSQVLKLDLKNRNGKWTRVASMNKKCYLMGATVYHDTLFVAGGANEKRESISSCERYYPIQNRWMHASPLNESRLGLALVFCDECLYALGGSSCGKYLSSVDRLEDSNEAWQNIQPLQTPRHMLAAVNCNGIVYAIGGKSDKVDSPKLKTVEKYNSVRNQWKYVSDMNIARSGHTACVLNDKIFVVGGVDDNERVVKILECYNPQNDSWFNVGSVADEWCHHSLITV